MDGLRKWEVESWMDVRGGRGGGWEGDGTRGHGGEMWEDRNQNFCKSTLQASEPRK